MAKDNSLERAILLILIIVAMIAATLMTTIFTFNIRINQLDARLNRVDCILGTSDSCTSGALITNIANGRYHEECIENKTIQLSRDIGGFLDQKCVIRSIGPVCLHKFIEHPEMNCSQNQDFFDNSTCSRAIRDCVNSGDFGVNDVENQDIKNGVRALCATKSNWEYYNVTACKTYALVRNE